jgi:hypothetical protein
MSVIFGSQILKSMKNYIHAIVVAHAMIHRVVMNANANLD